MRDARTAGGIRVLLALLLPAVAAAGIPAGAQTAELPGVGAGTITPETLFAFTASKKMIDPPPALPQKWFSAEAEFAGTVSTATADGVVVAESMIDSAHVGRSVRISGSSAAAGQIRQIASNSANQIDVTVPFDVVPEAGDSVEVFTGSLPPGRWDGACTQADPCLDINEAYLLAGTGAVWLWFDAGDVWDSDDEWCDLTHSPPGRCLTPPDPFRHRIMAQEYDDPAVVNEIRLGVSSTDLTGQTFAVIDCDSNVNYPPFGGGVFENQNGTSGAPAHDHPTSWMVVQGMETRCWNRPAPGSLESRNEWGEGTGVYKQEFSGKLLAIHNRHGDLWDGATLVSGNGGSLSHGDDFLGGVILVDIEANTADYSPMAGQCTATNTPFRSCQGTQFSGVGRGEFGQNLRPQFIAAYGGGAVLWIGGDAPNRNKSGGPYAASPRHVIELGGVNDYYSNSGVGLTEYLTLVNLQLAGTPGDPAPPDVVFALPLPDRWGTTYEVRILNSRFTEMPSGGAVVHFVPGWVANRATDTSLRMEWDNVDVERYGSVFAKDSSDLAGFEVDGGYDWTGRCLFIDEANPTPGVSRILDVQTGAESLDTRCKRQFLDLEGWIDGDDVPNQFNLCFADTVSYASQAMSGTMMQPGNAGYVNGWKIFAQNNSGDWGGEGVEIDARAALETSPEVQAAVRDACNEARIYPLGQTLPIGFISTPDNLISNITLAGRRDLGFNALWDQPACTPPALELYFTTAALDPNGKPVLYASDPNAPSAVTGYDLYRASVPWGPWTLVGANLVDMDSSTPGLQFIDATGDTGGDWYYKIAAVNGPCEGPR